MIKITKWFDDDIVKEYLNKMVKKIGCNYYKRLEKIESPAIKQFTMDFLSDENGFSDKKVREFLCKKFKFDDTEMQRYKDYCEEIQKIVKKDISFKDVESSIEVLLIDDKDKMKIKTYIEEIKHNTEIKRKKDELKKRVKKLIGAETPIIDYDYIQDDLRHKLILSLNISVCPYCNRQYITSWNDEKKKKKKTTADLDHFYPKSIFPAFSLSLFNFIPSCQICNSRMKGDKWSDVIYPYEERFGDDAYFEVTNLEKKVNNDNDYYDKLLRNLLGQSSELMELDIKINTESDKKIKIENSKDMFKLNEVYQTHKSYVKELLLKKRIYDDGAYLESLKNQFDKLNLDEYSLQQFLYGYNWQDGEDPDRPLSKLTYDILMR